MVALFLLAAMPKVGVTETLRLLNVSYDPTRELFREVNAAFVRAYEKSTGKKLRVYMSHGGSGKQARSILEGLEADVSTLALAYDIDALHSKGDLLPKDWRQRLPFGSVPYTSTIVFLVRPGNPKGIHDWPDLLKPGVKVVAANPKTSGGARWSYLAAYGQVLMRGGDSATAYAYVRELYRHVPVLDAAARGSVTTFAQRLIGDVCLTWENEAVLTLKKLPGQAEMVVPPISILAEPPVAVIETYARKHGVYAIAEAYLKFLYTKEGQTIAARNHYRPSDTAIAVQYAKEFPVIKRFSVDSLFGGWTSAHAQHFKDGAIFDQLILSERKPR